MGVSPEIVDRIRHFGEKRREAEAVYDRQSLTPAAFQVYDQRLDETLRLLQEQVKQQEDDLNKVWRLSSNTSAPMS